MLSVYKCPGSHEKYSVVYSAVMGLDVLEHILFRYSTGTLTFDCCELLSQPLTDLTGLLGSCVPQHLKFAQR